LYWQGIRWAHAQGCTIYDSCGIPDQVGKDPERYAHEGRNEALWGVYQFKRGFCRQVVCYMDTYDQVYNRRLYSLYNRALGLLKHRLGDTWHRKFFSG
jgi:lipid II:glycine glycyltransferase (peptidoglycan interpeptide bridge formation enzyme)